MRLGRVGLETHAQKEKKWIKFFFPIFLQNRSSSLFELSLSELRNGINSANFQINFSLLKIENQMGSKNCKNLLLPELALQTVNSRTK